MTDGTKIVNLADRRPNAAPPVPQHWMQRFGSPNPMSGQERADFTCEAGPHVNAWIAEIHDAGERQIQGVLELKWQQRILERLGYFDEVGNPRPELKGKFFIGNQLKPELWEQYPELMPEPRGAA